jgi:FAD:protein FMN transferase
MGCTAEVIVVGGDPALAETARERIAQLERRWSRFRPDSEVSELTRRAGRPVAVSGDTALLVERAIEAWRVTGGSVDATVLGAVVRAGYDRSFERLGDRARAPRSTLSIGGCPDITVHRLDDGSYSVCLPDGIGFDPGGLGKGLAADLVVSELMAQGAAGACVNLGGDLRVVGVSPAGAAWTVGVERPDGIGTLARLGLRAGAVATSSTQHRRWRVGGQVRHHLIDPTTGDPSTTDLVQATVVSADAWYAEALAKAVLLRGACRAFDVLAAGIEAVAVGRDGDVLSTPGLATYLGERSLPASLNLTAVGR